MRPLSTGTYFRHNKRKLISNVIIIIVAICLVYLLECFIASIVHSIYPLDATRFKYCSIMIATETVPEIPQDILDFLEASENIETVVSVSVRQISFSVPGSTTHTAVFSVKSADLPNIIDKFQIKITNGRMPYMGAAEIAIDKNVARNNHLQIGSQTESDRSHNLDKPYTVVGILESDSHISFVGSPEPDSSALHGDERGCLVFPKEGHFELAASEVMAFRSQGITVWTLSLYNKLYEKNNQTFQILDAMVIISITVMVVCLACSKYAQYFSCKREIGVLSALGYTHKEILIRTIKEIVLTNLIGFIIGLVLAIPLCRFIMGAFFDSVGGTGVYLYGKAIVLSLLAPLLTTVFTLIPVYRLIDRVDAISIIEKR